MVRRYELSTNHFLLQAVFCLILRELVARTGPGEKGKAAPEADKPAEHHERDAKTP
jgi:hypothetical protein